MTMMMKPMKTNLKEEKTFIITLEVVAKNREEVHDRFHKHIKDPQTKGYNIETVTRSNPR